MSDKKISRKDAAIVMRYKGNPDYLYFDNSHISKSGHQSPVYGKGYDVIQYFKSIFKSDKGIKCQECGLTYPQDFFGFIKEPVCAFCLASHPHCYCKQCGKIINSSVGLTTIKDKHTLDTLLDVPKMQGRSVFDILVSNVSDKIDYKLIDYISDNTLCPNCIENIIGLKGKFYDKQTSPKFNWLTFELDDKNMLVFHFFPSIPVKDTLLDLRDMVKPFLTTKINETLNLEALSLRSPSMGFMPYKNPIHYLDDSSFADLKETLFEMTTDFGSRAEKTIFEVTKSTDTLDILIILPNTVDKSEIEHIIYMFSESPLAIRQTSKKFLPLNGKPWDPCIWRMYRSKNAQTEFFTCSVYPDIKDVNIDIDENISIVISMSTEIRDKETIFLENE